MVFADFLTYEERLAMFTASFHAGGIFIIYADFIHDHKDKYFLLVIEAEVSTFFIINSEIPRIIARNQRWNDCQVMIEESEHRGIVEHSCYIDCTEPFLIKTSLIRKKTLDDMRRLRGNLNKATLERVKVSVEKDIRMSFSQKMPILQSLKAAISNQ